jgi:hypothetical protein
MITFLIFKILNLKVRVFVPLLSEGDWGRYLFAAVRGPETVVSRFHIVG